MLFIIDDTQQQQGKDKGKKTMYDFNIKTNS